MRFVLLIFEACIFGFAGAIIEERGIISDPTMWAIYGVVFGYIVALTAQVDL